MQHRWRHVLALLVALGVPCFRAPPGAAEQREIEVHLASTGSGTKSYQDPAGAFSQTMQYTFEIHFDLRATFACHYGDIIEYQLEEKAGTIDFQGYVSEDIGGDIATFDFQFPETVSLSGAGGRLEYSIAAKEVVYVEFSLEKDVGVEGATHIEYLAYNTPRMTRIFATLPPQWAFDPAFASCDGPAHVDFVGAPAIYDGLQGYPFLFGDHLLGLQGVGFGYSSFYRRWMLYQKRGFLQVDFDLASVPPEGRLVLRHLTSSSADCPNGGYSPITIHLNGQLIQANYDPASSHGGRFWFVVDRWSVAEHLQSGANSLVVSLDEDACTNHWIDYVGIDSDAGGCASCGSACGGGDPLSEACTPFQRGDSNDDISLDMSDSIFTLLHLFAGGPVPACEKAADANDDGLVNVSDPLYLLGFLFLSGPPIPKPFGACAADPTDDGLGCTRSFICSG